MSTSRVYTSVEVQYNGTEPTRVRQCINGEKVDVQPKQVISVEVPLANVLKGTGLWEIVGIPVKVEESTVVPEDMNEEYESDPTNDEGNVS